MNDLASPKVYTEISSITKLDPVMRNSQAKSQSLTKENIITYAAVNPPVS